ncbi:15733_t:CDS:2 [Racocetra fulgida]|uniref:15733_t:CDS:1 n=1 Tax=Racocetra fulgida TaxID=60492 RepID=A0A9N9EZX7_9GLOM|nr:15733_t:CDS:2 [Racocetra fulgida]
MNFHLPQSKLDKSLPSLPDEASKNNHKLGPPNRTIHPKRSFERDVSQQTIIPRSSLESADSIPKSHTLPISEDAVINRRHSRLFDSQLADILKNKTGKLNGHQRSDDKQKSREDLPKKHGIFSKRNDSIENLARMFPSKNRGEINEKHSRNASITSLRSEPYDSSNHTFSLNSNHSDKMELWSKSMHRKIDSSSSIKKKTLPNQQQLSHIDERSNSFSPNEIPSYSTYYPSHSNSPSTPSSNSPTSPDFPSSTNNDVPPRKGVYDSGPPVLPPLSFSDKTNDGNLDDALSDIKIESDLKIEPSLFTADFSDERSFKSQTGSIKTESIGDNSPGESPMSPERKDSMSSLTSASSKENEIIIIEPEDTSPEELKKQLFELKKKLAESESNFRKIKRVSQRAFDDFRMVKEDFNTEVTLRRKAEETVESLRSELELQHKTLETAKLDREHFEKILKDSKLSMDQLQLLQNELKELNLQKEIAINELEVLTKEKQAGLAENTPNVSNNLPGSIAKHLSTQFDLVKQNYLTDIKSLQMEKDSLLQETEELRNKRDQYSEEMKLLNAKNLELIEMNNELVRQLEVHSKGKVANKIFKNNKTSPYIDPECTDAPIVSVRNVDRRNSTVVTQPKVFQWIVRQGKGKFKFLGNTNVIGLPAHTNDHNREEAKKKMINQMFINQDAYPTSHGVSTEHEIEHNSMFGLDLTKQAELDGDEVPYIVLKCILAVELRGMDLEGIYRKSGGATQMREIIAAFDQGKDFDLETPHQFNDICAVTSVLKRYLRELPNPLLTFELYQSFLDAIGKEMDKNPCADNRMNAKNLSVVFGPTLLRGPNPTNEIFDMNSKNMIVEYIIENVNTLFPTSSNQNNIERRKDGFI